MSNKLNKIDQLYFFLDKNVKERTEYTNILDYMDSINDKGKEISVYFKMFIHNRNVGWDEVKHNEQAYEIPHELNEQIYHLVHNYFFKQIKELEQERDKIMSKWLEQSKEIKGVK